MDREERVTSYIFLVHLPTFTQESAHFAVNAIFVSLFTFLFFILLFFGLLFRFKNRIVHLRIQRKTSRFYNAIR